MRQTFLHLRHLSRPYRFVRSRYTWLDVCGWRTTLDQRWADTPRFKERLPAQFTHQDVNPYLLSHRAFGHPLYPSSEAAALRGKWDEVFGRSAPLYLEIGSGNGFFLSGYANARPDINLVGVEIRYKRTVMCAEKIQKVGATNAAIVRYDAWFLDDLISRGALDGIFVLHPDPWPKTRHVKNRLISRWFLELAEALLKPVARCASNQILRQMSRVFELLHTTDEGADAPALGLEITAHSEDIISGGPIWSPDIETNYQSKYRRKSLPVAAIELTRAHP